MKKYVFAIYTFIIAISLLNPTLAKAESNLFSETKDQALKDEDKQRLEKIKSNGITKKVNIVNVNVNAFELDNITLLIDDINIKLKKEKSKSKNENDWVGVFDGDEYGEAIFNKHNDKITGCVKYGLGQKHRVFILLPYDDTGNYLLIEQDWRKFLPD